MGSVEKVMRSAVILSVLLPVLDGCGSSAGGPDEGGRGGAAMGSPTGGSPGTGGTTASGGSSPSGAGGMVGSGGAPGAGGSGSGGISAAGGRSSGGTGGGAGAPGGVGGNTSGSGGNAGAGEAGGRPGGGGSAGAGGTTHTGTWKVMMLGDSVTESTCYPQLTYQQIKAGGHTNFELVGSRTTNQSCGSGAPSSIKDEGHAGYGVTYLPANSTRGACTKSTGCGSYAELQTWAAEKPDIVLMHFGTNDVWDGVPTATIMAAYVAVISEFRKQNPNVIFFVSKIIKLSPSGCGSCLTNVAALAAAVTPAWASANATPSSPVTIVDHYDSGFSPTNSADTSDGVHPTPTGAAILATVTANALAAAGYF